MGDLQVHLLRHLAPFNATVAKETAQVDPVDQGGIQRVWVKICSEGIHVMDHLIINHVTPFGFLLKFLDYFEDYVYIIISGMIWGWSLAVYL